MALDWKQVAEQEGLIGDNTSPSNEPTAVAVKGPAKNLGKMLHKKKA